MEHALGDGVHYIGNLKFHCLKLLFIFLDHFRDLCIPGSCVIVYHICGRFDYFITEQIIIKGVDDLLFNEILIDRLHITGPFRLPGAAFIITVHGFIPAHPGPLAGHGSATLAAKDTAGQNIHGFRRICATGALIGFQSLFHPFPKFLGNYGRTSSGDPDNFIIGLQFMAIPLPVYLVINLIEHKNTDILFIR
ncbi:hypothetical protein JCM21531_3024 [Acetivibrio straminisolvens JCM 21531]|uniref:Uncharacterized protein n=1 Tax=Acetivibrio straminisolvens JCM 21531 TaxID=1294263 RepID=W4V8G1_9FIRM|nr:hypothetical protein JCM21531_3024 [Acetivibrio straminisolvens JCM 21531]